MIIYKRKMSLGAVYLTSPSFTRLRPRARTASGGASFLLEFVGQRSHIVLGYRGALREVESDLNDLRVFGGKRIDKARDAAESGENLAALVDAPHYNSYGVFASRRVGDAIKAGDRRGIEGEDFFDAIRDVCRMVRQPAAKRMAGRDDANVLALMTFADRLDQRLCQALYLHILIAD